MSILTDADREIMPLIPRANKGFPVGCKWYLNGWEPTWYQYVFHQAPQPNVSFLAGIATGKTTAVAASYLMDCISIPYFRALNTSVTAKQSELPFEMVAPWIDSNPRLEHLVDNVSLRPYPTIDFKNGSVWVFRTAGKGARFIRGMEFDRINYDECGLDFDGETPKVLRGRLRGTRSDGTPRMIRLDATTSPTAAPWLRERFDRGWKGNPEADLARYLSMRVSTYDNPHLTKETIYLMEQEYSDDMIEVELKAMFPDYGASMFPSVHVQACTDQSINDALEMGLRPESGPVKPGYREESHHRYGPVLFEMPYDPTRIYIQGGDPGTDGPPHRNSPVVMVMDITEVPHKVVYFHWIDGRGSYNPFLMSYKYAMQKYYPVLKGVDTTGTQKAIDELAFENVGIQIDGINFQRDKQAMLNSLSMAVTSHTMRWPAIKGIVSQLASYTRDADDKIPQDIVMTMAELAFLARYAPEDHEKGSSNAARANYRNRNNRSNYARRR